MIPSPDAALGDGIGRSATNATSSGDCELEGEFISQKPV
jgi:hypothetical protein